MALAIHYTFLVSCSLVETCEFGITDHGHVVCWCPFYQSAFMILQKSALDFPRNKQRNRQEAQSKVLVKQMGLV